MPVSTHPSKEVRTRRHPPRGRWRGQSTEGGATGGHGCRRCIALVAILVVQGCTDEPLHTGPDEDRWADVVEVEEERSEPRDMEAGEESDSVGIATRSSEPFSTDLALEVPQPDLVTGPFSVPPIRCDCPPPGPGVYDGSIIWYDVEVTAAMLEELQQYTAIRGSLEIWDTEFASISLPNLEVVCGELHLLYNEFSQLSLPNLTCVDVFWSGGSYNVESIDLPSLVVSRKMFGISYNPRLAVLTTPVLEQTDEYYIHTAGLLTRIYCDTLTRVNRFTISSNEELRSVYARNLTSATEVFVWRNPHLIGLNLSNLRDVDDRVWLERNPELQTLLMPNLAHVNGDVEIYDLAAESLLLPSLEHVGALYLSENPSMTTLDLSGLRWVEERFSVHDNRALPQCRVDEVFEQLEGFMGEVEMYGNSEECP